jgi:hypothetical protein
MYLHQPYAIFEHEIGCGIGSGDSGDIFSTLKWRLTCTG